MLGFDSYPIFLREGGGTGAVDSAQAQVRKSNNCAQLKQFDSPYCVSRTLQVFEIKLKFFLSFAQSTKLITL